MTDIRQLVLDPMFTGLPQEDKTVLLSRYFDRNIATGSRYSSLSDDGKSAYQSHFVKSYIGLSRMKNVSQRILDTHSEDMNWTSFNLSYSLRKHRHGDKKEYDKAFKVASDFYGEKIKKRGAAMSAISSSLFDTKTSEISRLTSDENFKKLKYSEKEELLSRYFLSRVVPGDKFRDVYDRDRRAIYKQFMDTYLGDVKTGAQKEFVSMESSDILMPLSRVSVDEMREQKTSSKISLMNLLAPSTAETVASRAADLPESAMITPIMEYPGEKRITEDNDYRDALMDLLNDPRYIAFEPEKKANAIAMFFDKYISETPNYKALSQDDKEYTRKMFMRRYFYNPLKDDPKLAGMDITQWGEEDEMLDVGGSFGWRNIQHAFTMEEKRKGKTTEEAVEIARKRVLDVFGGERTVGHEMGRLHSPYGAGRDSGVGFLPGLGYGFAYGAYNLFAMPYAALHSIMGDANKGQYIAGQVDAALESHGYDDMDFYDAIKDQDFKRLGAISLKGFALNAPNTVVWAITGNMGGFVSAALSGGSSKYLEMDRDRDDVSLHKKALSAIWSGLVEGTTEILGNNIKFGKLTSKAITKRIITQHIKDALTTGGMKTFAKEVFGGALEETIEEMVSETADMLFDAFALGIDEWNWEEFLISNFNAGMGGFTSGGLQSFFGGIIARATTTNYMTKINNLANTDLSKIQNTTQWNEAKQTIEFARRTRETFQFAESQADLSAAKETAKENAKAIERVINENKELSRKERRNLKSLGLYNALLVDIITGYQFSEEAEFGDYDDYRESIEASVDEAGAMPTEAEFDEGRERKMRVQNRESATRRVQEEVSAAKMTKDFQKVKDAYNEYAAQGLDSPKMIELIKSLIDLFPDEAEFFNQLSKTVASERVEQYVSAALELDDSSIIKIVQDALSEHKDRYGETDFYKQVSKQIDVLSDTHDVEITKQVSEMADEDVSKRAKELHIETKDKSREDLEKEVIAKERQERIKKHILDNIMQEIGRDKILRQTSIQALGSEAKKAIESKDRKQMENVREVVNSAIQEHKDQRLVDIRRSLNSEIADIVEQERAVKEKEKAKKAKKAKEEADKQQREDMTKRRKDELITKGIEAAAEKYGINIKQYETRSEIADAIIERQDAVRKSLAEHRRAMGTDYEKIKEAAGELEVPIKGKKEVLKQEVLKAREAQIIKEISTKETLHHERGLLKEYNESMKPKVDETVQKIDGIVQEVKDTRIDLSRETDEAKRGEHEAEINKNVKVIDSVIAELKSIQKEAGGNYIAVEKIQAEINKLEKVARPLSEADVTQRTDVNLNKANELIDTRSIEETGVIPEAQIGDTATVSKENDNFEITYILVPIDEVVTSHNIDTLNQNENYPAELQNRVRENHAEDVNKIAAKLNPRILMHNDIASDGRPIGFIGKDGKVYIIAGNGRTIALKMRADGQYGNLNQYEQVLKSNLKELGFQDQDVAGKMLVGIYNGREDLVKLAISLNRGETQALSETEAARTDARTLIKLDESGDGIIRMLSRKGDILSESNNKFINAFIDEVVPESERSKYRAKGKILVKVEERIKNALFMYVFDDSSKAASLLSSLKDVGDSNVKSMLHGIMENVKEMALLKYLDASYDFSSDLIDAVHETESLRAKGENLDIAQNQMDVFADDEVKSHLLTAVYRIKSPKEASGFVKAYTEISLNYADGGQDTMDFAKLTKEQIRAEFLKRWLFGEIKDMKSAKEAYIKARELTVHKPLAELEFKLYEAMAEQLAPRMGLTVDEYFAKYFDVFTTEAPTETETEASEQSIEYQLQAENKELLTIHNLSEDKLREAIKQGGMPMPSLAIINTKQTQHDEFGEISLIASPSILQISRKSPVYSQDAWTPTYPTVYHRVEESSMDNAKKIAEKINKRYKTKVDTYEIMNDAQRQNYTGTIEEIITRIVKKSMNGGTFDDALKYARYLLKSHPLETREEIRGLNDKYGNARYRPNTAEEVMKMMRYDRNRADKQIWEARELIGKIAPKFSSMSDVNKNKWRLMSKEARNNAVDSTMEKIQEIVKQSKEKRHEYRSFFATTDVANDIYDIAQGKERQVRERYAPDTDFSQFHEIIREIKKIPTDMFEAKPDRVVNLNEFTAAIVPYGTDKKVINALKKDGIQISFYEKGNEVDRHAKTVNEAEKRNILFQSQESVQKLIKGYVERMPNGKYRVGFMDADATTGLHEQGHIGKDMLYVMAEIDPAWERYVKIAEEFCGVGEDGVWTTDAEEKFANGYVKYITEGKAPTPQLKTVFEKIKDLISKVVSKLADIMDIELTDDIREVYGALLGAEITTKEDARKAKVDAFITKVDAADFASKDVDVLTKRLDSEFGSRSRFITDRKLSRGKVHMNIIDIDMGNTIVNIAQVDDGYIVNGEHAYNNGEAMDIVNKLIDDYAPGDIDMGEKDSTRFQMPSYAREIMEVRKKYEGTDQWMKAPNGKPTNLTERQWLHTQTESFKEWFGNSKIVDENGDPRVVYHGVSQEGRIDFFDRAKLGEHTRARSAEKGFFFAKDIDTSSIYGVNIAEEAVSLVSSVGQGIRSLIDIAAEMNVSDGEFYKDIIDNHGLIIEEQNALMDTYLVDTLYDFVSEMLENVREEAAYIEESEGRTIDISEAEIDAERVMKYIESVKNSDIKNIERLFLSIENPAIHDYKGEKYRDKSYDKVLSDALKAGKDGAILRNTYDGAGMTDIYVAFTDTQMKSATENIGAYGRDTNLIRYQKSDAYEKKQKFIQEQNETNAKIIREELDTAPSAEKAKEAVVNAIKRALMINYEGAEAMDVIKRRQIENAIKEQQKLGNTETVKQLEAEVEMMKKRDQRFRDILREETGFRSVNNLSLESALKALDRIDPVLYDRFVNESTRKVLVNSINLLESMGKKGFVYDKNTLDLFFDYFTSEHVDTVKRSGLSTLFLMPQRYLVETFGKAGHKLVKLAYIGMLKRSDYEHQYHSSVQKIYDLQMTNKNNRGMAYAGEEISIIGETIFKVDGNSKIEPKNKLNAIQNILGEWAEKNDTIINMNDIEEMYRAKQEIIAIFKGFIVEFNNSEIAKLHGIQIGLIEEYGNPRIYEQEGSAKPAKDKILHVPANVKERTEVDYNAKAKHNTNLYEVYLSYATSMAKYMAFYELATYMEGNEALIPGSGEGENVTIVPAQFYRDISSIQRVAARGALKENGYVDKYIKNVIGTNETPTSATRIFDAFKTIAFASTLVPSIPMTMLNFHQRSLIDTQVGADIAWQVRKDIKFFSGRGRFDAKSFPTLARIMDTYRGADSSLIADTASTAQKSATEGGRNWFTSMYYKGAEFSAKMLEASPFSKAELGNRAYAHLAGIYQIVAQTAEYKQARKDGMNFRQAVEHVLTNHDNIRQDAIHNGGVVNAEINADVNPAFAPRIFWKDTGLHKYLMFVRYGITLAQLEMRKLAAPFLSMKSRQSQQIYDMIRSGDIQAADHAQYIQAAQIMLKMTDERARSKMFAEGKIDSKKTRSDRLSIGEVEAFHSMIQQLINESTEAAMQEHSDVIKSKKTEAMEAGQMLSFAVREQMLRTILALVISMLPIWRKDKKEIDIIAMLSEFTTYIELLQTPQTITDFRLGGAMVPRMEYYHKDRQRIKELTDWALRVTPGLGILNNFIKGITGRSIAEDTIDTIAPSKAEKQRQKKKRRK